MKKTIFLSTILLLLVGCNSAKPHEHTFSDKWSFNETNHWKDATCEHNDLTKDLKNHTFGNDGKCTVCGYDSHSKYKVLSENDYQNAINMSNVTHVQREFHSSLFNDFIYTNIVKTQYVSPNINYDFTHYATCIDGSSNSITNDEFYFSKENNKTYKYKIDSTSQKWVKEECDSSEFISPSDLSPMDLELFGDVSYETIKDKYDEKFHSYIFQGTRSSKTYDIVLNFLNNRLIYAEFINKDKAFTYIRYYSFSII